MLSDPPAELSEQEVADEDFEIGELQTVEKNQNFDKVINETEFFKHSLFSNFFEKFIAGDMIVCWKSNQQPVGAQIEAIENDTLIVKFREDNDPPGKGLVHTST